MARKRKAIADELRAVGDDVRRLAETVVQDPKQQARRRRAWRLLYGALSAVAALAARRAATKAYGVLTGEAPPGARAR